MAIDLFERCHQTFVQIAERSRVPDAEARGALSFDADVFDLLQQLGYLARDPRKLGVRVASQDGHVFKNQSALLKLAGKLERFFRLPSQWVPNGYFLGAEVAPAAFGLSGCDGLVVGVGGRGTSFREAFESCLGEAAEYLSFLAWGDEDVRDAMPRQMLRGEEEIFDAAAARPTDLSHEDMAWMLSSIGRSLADLDRSMGWILASRLTDGGTLAFPESQCLRRLGSVGLPSGLTAESNGCAAGPTYPAAIERALLEVVERDAVALWWYGGRPAFRVAPDPELEASVELLCEQLGRSDGRPHWCLCLTEEMQIPVIAAISSTAEGAALAYGFAASPDPFTAMRSAILEMCQMELAQELKLLKLQQDGEEALNAADRQWLERMVRLRLDAFPRLRPEASVALTSPGSMGHEDGLDHGLRCLRRRGFQAYALDLTRRPVGVPAARVLVPGLQSGKADRVSERLRLMSESNGIGEHERLNLPIIL